MTDDHTAQPDTAPDTGQDGPDDTGHDTGQDDGGQDDTGQDQGSASREAKRYRLRLREAERERDEARDLLAKQRQALLDGAATAGRIDRQAPPRRRNQHRRHARRERPDRRRQAGRCDHHSHPRVRYPQTTAPGPQPTAGIARRVTRHKLVVGRAEGPLRRRRLNCVDVAG